MIVYSYPMSWVAHGTAAGLAQSRTVPAVATHRGRLWVLWTDPEGVMWYAATTARQGHFGPRRKFPHAGQTGRPAVTSVNGELHAVVVLETGALVHYVYVYDDDDEMSWECRGSLPATGGVVADGTPALASFRNGLWLVYLRNGQMSYMCYSLLTREWTQPRPICEEVQFSGNPALFVIKGVLQLLCASATRPDRMVLVGFEYDDISSVWRPCVNVPQLRAVSGISAVSYGDKVYMSFTEAGLSEKPRTARIAAYDSTKQGWQSQEILGGDGVSAVGPPQLAILNGRIHVIFNDGSFTRELRWYSRSITKEYDLASWMGSVGDETLLSAMTIPGTHDSCARSNIPFVRTQYLSISQQLELGIRFFDLRLRRHDDSKLYCYHGGVALGFPKLLPFEAVMNEIWDFIRPENAEKPTTETVLISIDNDDNSKEQEENPAVFYNAVADAIANTPPWPDGSSRWYTEPTTAQLGDVRGKAVLLRRHRGDPGVEPEVRHGLDLSAWVNDSPNFTIVTPTNVRIHLQDKWHYSERMGLEDLVGNKSSHVNRLMDFASWNPYAIPDEGVDMSPLGEQEDHTDEVEAEWAPETWFVNFCSAVGDPVQHGEVAEAKWIAVGAYSGPFGRGKWIDGINRRTRDYICQEGSGKKRLGIIIFDYPELPVENDVVARLIETNF